MGKGGEEREEGKEGHWRRGTGSNREGRKSEEGKDEGTDGREREGTEVQWSPKKILNYALLRGLQTTLGCLKR